MAEDKDTVERAKEILVYGPIGLALYMRDTAPSFLKVFVARGRAEFDQHKRTVGEHLGQAKNVGQETVNPSASATASAAASAAASSAAAAAPQVLRLVSDSLGKFRETAEGALGVLGARGVDIPPVPPTPSSTSPTSSAAAPASTAWTAPPPPRPAPAASSASAPSPTESGEPALAIPDYDELSASQVVDRLDGLAPAALDAIRAYETAHRGRATIIGKIEQLSQTG